jgi:hypothetical protein
MLDIKDQIEIEDGFELDLATDAENESDLPSETISSLSSAHVQDTDWTTETILLQLKKDNIKLNPRFQRRDAWDDERKSKFIESLLLGLPIPQIVLAENHEKKGTFIVIDGKQRLLALQKFAMTEDQGRSLKLRDLSLLKNLNGLTYQNIKETPEHQHLIPVFENQTIRTTVIRGWRDENVLYTIFYRLNSGSLPLSPQELRHVLHPGPFVDFAFDFTDNSKQINSLFSKKSGPDFRMRDVELLIRHLGFRLFLKDYNGDLKKFLDQTCIKLNAQWDGKSDDATTYSKIIEKNAQELEEAIEATKQIFPDRTSFKKWSKEAYEPRFNRAVFDVMTYYFGIPRIRETAIHQAPQVRAEFQRLCDNNSDFRKSLETTTKSTYSTFSRIVTWGQSLSQILNTPIPESEEFVAKTL